MLSWCGKEGDLDTHDGSIKIAYIHTLGTSSRQSFKAFQKGENANVSYRIGDIVNMDGNLYEVENVKDEYVYLSHEDGCTFSVEFGYIKLVCRRENRQDYIIESS